VRRRPHDLRELVGAVVNRLEPKLDGHRVELEIPEELPPVACDYAQVDQVVTNLLENAVNHTPPGTSVLTRACVEGEDVRVEVLDDGPGIAAADRERVFRPFERGRTRAHGSGLGLTIARGFVEAHGGRLWVEDAAAGHGARFVFTLPVATSEA
jgi:two-component system sensor histidine kinase KdpD